MAEFLSATTTFKIGTTTISKMKSTPDMGSEPDKVDVTSFDNEKYKSYITGLMDPGSLVFEFWDDTTNFNAAKTAESTTTASYTLEFPDGSTYTWSGTHRVYKLGASVGDAISFAIACTPSTELTYTSGTAST